MLLSFLFKIVLCSIMLAIPIFGIAAAEGMPQFNSKTFSSQIFWLIVTFGILYFFITLMILPRIRENIRLRKNKISNNIERAESIKIDIEKMIKEYDIKIEEAKNKAKTMIKKALIKSANDYKNQLDLVKKQISKKQLEAEQKIKVLQENSEKNLTKAAITLSATMLNKLELDKIDEVEIEKILKKSNKIEGNN